MSEWLTGLFWRFLILSVLVPMAVHTDMPPEVYRLMELYPQPMRRQPAVKYLPLPTPGPAGRQPVKR